MIKALLAFLCLFSSAYTYETCFIAVDEQTEEVISSHGSLHNTRFSPCSTFKIPLSLMGYDLGILIDEENPVWVKGDDDVEFETWLGPQNPRSWINFSVVWYSQILAKTMGFETMQKYVNAFNYGNKDISGDPGKDNSLTRSWLDSSLKISPLEQIAFLLKVYREQLPVSPHAFKMTKNILYRETLPSGEKLYARTGTGAMINNQRVVWIVGWYEKESKATIFSLLLLLQSHEKPPTRQERQAIVQKFLVLSS